MKICCVIDSLNSGGAQRQMVALVDALSQRKHEVRLLTYHGQYDHFLADLQACGVEPENVSASNKLTRCWKMRRTIRKNRPDCIISFLNTPNLLSVFSSLAPKRIPLVVSERSLDTQGKTFSNRIRFQVFRLADRVVTNSKAQSHFIAEHFAYLNNKTEVIHNCVDLNTFHPRKSITRGPGRHLLVAASVIPVKNTHRFVKAIKLANDRLPKPVCVDWFGNNLFDDGKPTKGSDFFLKAKEMTKSLGIENEFRFYNTVSDIHKRFANYDAVCLPSVYEGCPNIICEAMASGKPVLTSSISDLTDLVSDTNLLFEPTSTDSIADTIRNFAALSDARLKAIGERNRVIAEEQFAQDRFAASYERLIQEVVRENWKS